MHLSNSITYFKSIAIKRSNIGSSILAGSMLPLAFAPFNQWLLAFLSFAMLFQVLLKCTPLRASFCGFLFGLSSFSISVSWVFNSIYAYGQINLFLSFIFTLAFILYLSLFSALVCYLFAKLRMQNFNIFNYLLFACLWGLGEYLRSFAFTGFPWVLVGFSQVDSILKYCFPLFGVYGVSILVVFISSFFVGLVFSKNKISVLNGLIFLCLICGIFSLKKANFSEIIDKPLSVSIIQANLAMRDKWDERLFWELVNQYKDTTLALLDDKELIVLPESALPVPTTYLETLLDDLDSKARAKGSAILLGSLEQDSTQKNRIYNTMLSLGNAQGSYHKKHLVPFGEYIPKFFVDFLKLFGFSIENMLPGHGKQELIKINDHHIASLICYELAYPSLLRIQLPKAELIVSISDDGWFGKSLALYQHLQMAQALSLQSGRYQIVANNDGLSSIINASGEIVKSLPAHQKGILKESITFMKGQTPWVYWGELPIVILITFMMITAIIISQKTKTVAGR